ncbi:hypothetical protein C8J57DRAFT_1348710 [Mycena rebaudengoi]|nr:hypothetical protein C8J57DRAFT_1348710 [Mycena rebaudengoi]
MCSDSTQLAATLLRALTLFYALPATRAPVPLHAPARLLPHTRPTTAVRWPSSPAPLTRTSPGANPELVFQASPARPT